MTRILSLIACLFLFISVADAQEKCLTEILFQEEAAKNPELLKQREAQEAFIREFLQNAPLERTAGGVVRIIPVVVHVIHYGGPENISDAQIHNAIDILNADMRRLNADTTMTPSAWLSVAADAEIEFQLAKLDDNGNCTNGIVRVYNSMTYNARSNIKALSYWPSNKYLNLWVVNSITNVNGLPGQVIGFAQFPGIGNAATDGVVIKYDFMGAIGAANAQGAGRTVTHEVGHWLGLRHIWGDDGGACGGNGDYVGDTPDQGDWTLSTCPSFPALDNCQPNSPGIMYSNYMDYTNGNCQNLFTTGQVGRFNATLASSTSGRNNLHTAGNLQATGITGGATGLCPAQADFIAGTDYICEGDAITFEDGSWNGTVVSRVWQFPGGTPSTDTSANPVITYNTAGTYDVTLTVTNGLGSTAKTVTGRVVVNSASPALTVPFNEGFEGAGTFPYAGWGVNNTNGPTSNTWGITSSAGSSSAHSLLLNNISNNDKGFDEFVTPAFDLSNVTNTMLTFDVAYAPMRQTPAPGDKLVVMYSLNCGRTWQARLTLTSSQLSTLNPGDTLSTSFVPSSTQWSNKTLNLATTSISTKPNVRFKFQFTHDNGNNLYVDNINLNGTVTALDEINAQNATVNVYPNPSSSDTYVDFTLAVSGKVNINITDVSGRIISTFSDDLQAGDHQYTIPEGLVRGVYLVQFTFGEYSSTKRVVIR